MNVLFPYLGYPLLTTGNLCRNRNSGSDDEESRKKKRNRRRSVSPDRQENQRRKSDQQKIIVVPAEQSEKEKKTEEQEQTVRRDEPTTGRSDAPKQTADGLMAQLGLTPRPGDTANASPGYTIAVFYVVSTFNLIVTHSLF